MLISSRTTLTDSLRNRVNVGTPRQSQWRANWTITGLNPVHQGSHPHDPFTSRRPHLQMPSHCGLGFNMWTLEDHGHSGQPTGPAPSNNPGTKSLISMEKTFHMCSLHSWPEELSTSYGTFESLFLVSSGFTQYALLLSWFCFVTLWCHKSYP